MSLPAVSWAATSSSDEATVDFGTSSLGFFSTEVTLAEEADVESGIVVGTYGRGRQGMAVSIGLGSMIEYKYSAKPTPKGTHSPEKRMMVHVQKSGAEPVSSQTPRQN